ncbi:hypothetical protein COL922a_012285 [Colletotrichum nupharicola]|nr:hypothetical protein COL922a_012285 [Colletotrichum nupharicola]
MVSNIKKDRKSMFKEVGLEDDSSDEDMPGTPTSQHARDRKESVSSEKEFGDAGELVSERTRSSNDDSNGDGDGDGDGEYGRRAETGRHEQSSNPQRQNSMQVGKPAWYTILRRPKIKSVSSAPPPTVASLQRFAMIALIIAVILPAFSYSNGGQNVGSGADAGVIRPRQTTSTDVCLRWSQQGGLFVYYIDLTKSWDRSSPSLTGKQKPDGPPAVANGYLWNDYNYLYLYGGQFADNDGAEGVYATPAAMSIWR